MPFPLLSTERERASWFVFTGITVTREGGQMILFLTFDFKFNTIYFITLAKVSVGKCSAII